MQISDELLVRLETAINTVMDDAEVDYPIGYHKGMHRVSWDAAEMRRALEAALSLPVQPVAWRWKRKGAAVWIYDAPLEWLSEQGDAIDKQPLYANPVPPTKGPEDDLIAAREAAKEAGGEHSYVAIQAALLALRSRPASALPVVGEATETIETYFARQIEWSRNTFGPALRTGGVIDHIRKELGEIEADPHDLSEWIDVIILAMDGFWRHGGAASDLLPRLLAKQQKNMARAWPDWRKMSEDQAIEHDRSGEAPSVQP